MRRRSVPAAPTEPRRLEPKAPPDERLHISTVALVRGLARARPDQCCGRRGREPYPEEDARIPRQPLILFVAKGAANACGPGCSEWIAAEGLFDFDAPQRLRDFLTTLPRRDLPVFFNSDGGKVKSGMEIGRLLRDHRMTVGIGRTVPDGCPECRGDRRCLPPRHAIAGRA